MLGRNEIPIRVIEPKDVQVLQREKPARALGRGLKAGGKALTAIEKMAKAGFDPLDASISLAQGHFSGAPHPFIKILSDRILDIIDLLNDRHTDAVKSKLYELAEEAEKELSEAFVDPSIRAGMIKDLLQYAYPKLRAMDINIDNGVSLSDLPPLSKTEVRNFEEWFDGTY